MRVVLAKKVLSQQWPLMTLVPAWKLGMDTAQVGSQLSFMVTETQNSLGRDLGGPWEQDCSKLPRTGARAGCEAAPVALSSADTTDLEQQSFLCCLLAPGALHSTRVTLRKLQMEIHDKNNCLGSRIQKLRKNRMYVAKATLILFLYAYEL